MGLRGPERNAQRERAIFDRWLAGETLDSIGKSYGVSRERIRQIVSKCWDNTQDPEAVDRIISRIAGKSEIKKHDLTGRRDARRALKDLFKTSFDRDQIIRTLGMEDDADIYGCTDEQLCKIVFDSLRIRRFFKYIRCTSCEGIKPVSDFARSSVLEYHTCYCRKCNTDRHRHAVVGNPQILKNAYQHVIDNPNRARIYQLRHYYLIQGRMDEMPPLPPRGVKDSEIVAPPKREHGYGLKMWRASQPPTFDRKKAAEKARRLVKEDAAKRHITI